MYNSLVYNYHFTSQREFHSVPDTDVFVIPSLILSQLKLSRIELPKLTPSILMENCDPSVCPGWWILLSYAPAHKLTCSLAFKKFIIEADASWYNLKITCILLKQVISPKKKKVVSSAKITLLISWSRNCIPLILINESSK